MASFSSGSGTDTGGYDYVSSTAPSDPAEGDEWFDTSNNAGKTWDGAAWVKDYKDSEARTAVDGANVNIAGDSDTVDGYHGGDLKQSLSVATPNNVTGSRSSNTWYQNTSGNPLMVYVTVDTSGNLSTDFYISPDQTMDSGEMLGGGSSTNEAQAMICAIVPDGYYYHWDQSNNDGLVSWTEQQVTLT